MDKNERIAAIEAERAQVEDQLNSSVGTSSMCSLEKSNQVTRSMKYLEGQQQKFRGAIRTLRTSNDGALFLKYLRDEQLKHEKMRNGPVGASLLWQEYLEGSLAALNQMQAWLGGEE